MSDVTIRLATIADLPQMLVNAASFLDAIDTGIPFHAPSMDAMLAECIDSGLCFIAEHDGLHIGGIGAVQTVLPVNHNIEVAVERFFWMVPDERAKGVGAQLLTALRDAAKAANCERLIMVALVNDYLPRVENSYLRFGLKPAERTYEMRL